MMSTTKTTTPATTTGTSRRRLLAALGLVVALAHLAALPRTLEDLDSVNLALGVESFDVSSHRPHPPGYPVYIALGKLSDRAVATVAPGWPRDRRAAVGLALWSVVAATAAVWVLPAFWTALGLSPTQAVLASLLALVSPLFWLTASRPLTDVPGLVAALAVQAALLSGLRAYHAAGREHVPAVWWYAAAAAGFVIGVRTQTMWLTGPLLCWCGGELVSRGQWREALGLVAAAAAGVLVWLVPLIVVTGGPDAYLSALAAQAADDFAGVEMLATQPTWALLMDALSRTFTTPWLGGTLDTIVIGLAALGGARLVRRAPRVLALMLLAFLPYLVFHLTFQETATIRYGLPLVVPVTALAVIAVFALPRRAAVTATVALAAASWWVAQPPLSAYAAEGAPIFRALADLEATLERPGTEDDPTALGMHRRIASESRQALVWAAEAWPFAVLPSERGAEVAAVVDYWRAGGTGPLWFLASPVRRDLDLIDARARTLHARYQWPIDTRALLAQARPTDVDAWIIAPPRWMLGTGWALTPEIGGVTWALGHGPHRVPAESYLLRDRAPLRVVVGGRHLGPDDSPPVALVARLDGVEVSRWTVSSTDRSFVHWITLPEGTPPGEGRYATLTVAVEGAPESRSPVGLEFFDAATPEDVLWVFARGWHEPEQEAATGVSWRWMSREGQVSIEAPSVDLTVTISGESPARYVPEGVDLTVRAGGVEVARRRLRDDFRESFRVPRAALAASGGAVTFEVSDAWVPAERARSRDRRQLGLRVFNLQVDATR